MLSLLGASITLSQPLSGAAGSASLFLTYLVGGKKSNIQHKNASCAEAWIKHVVTVVCLFILYRLSLLAPSFLAYFKSVSNPSTETIYFLNTFIPLNSVFMVGSCCCKHSAEDTKLNSESSQKTAISLGPSFCPVSLE